MRRIIAATALGLALSACGTSPQAPPPAAPSVGTPFMPGYIEAITGTGPSTTPSPQPTTWQDMLLPPKENR